MDTSVKISKIKHIIYLISSAILGILINYFILVAIQVIYLQWVLHSDKNIIWYSGYPPYPVLIYGFLLIGALWGFFAGHYWWELVYIEHRQWKNWHKLK